MEPGKLPLVAIIARSQTPPPRRLNLSAIFSKTGKGVQEASGKTSHLSRADRAVLSAIDGKTTLAEVQKKFEKLAGSEIRGADPAARQGRLHPRSVFRAQSAAPTPRPAAPAAKGRRRRRRRPATMRRRHGFHAGDQDSQGTGSRTGGPRRPHRQRPRPRRSIWPRLRAPVPSARQRRIRRSTTRREELQAKMKAELDAKAKADARAKAEANGGRGSESSRRSEKPRRGRGEGEGRRGSEDARGGRRQGQGGARSGGAHGDRGQGQGGGRRRKAKADAAEREKARRGGRTERQARCGAQGARGRRAARDRGGRDRRARIWRKRRSGTPRNCASGSRPR